MCALEMYTVACEPRPESGGRSASTAVHCVCSDVISCGSVGAG